MYINCTFTFIFLIVAFSLSAPLSSSSPSPFFVLFLQSGGETRGERKRPFSYSARANQQVESKGRQVEWRRIPSLVMLGQ